MGKQNTVTAPIHSKFIREIKCRGIHNVVYADYLHPVAVEFGIFALKMATLSPFFTPR